MYNIVIQIENDRDIEATHETVIKSFPLQADAILYQRGILKILRESEGLQDTGRHSADIISECIARADRLAELTGKTS